MTAQKKILRKAYMFCPVMVGSMSLSGRPGQQFDPRIVFHIPPACASWRKWRFLSALQQDTRAALQINTTGQWHTRPTSSLSCSSSYLTSLCFCTPFPVSPPVAPSFLIVVSSLFHLLVEPVGPVCVAFEALSQYECVERGGKTGYLVILPLPCTCVYAYYQWACVVLWNMQDLCSCWT